MATKHLHTVHAVDIGAWVEQEKRGWPCVDTVRPVDSMQAAWLEICPILGSHLIIAAIRIHIKFGQSAGDLNALHTLKRRAVIHTTNSGRLEDWYICWNWDEPVYYKAGIYLPCCRYIYACP